MFRRPSDCYRGRVVDFTFSVVLVGVLPINGVSSMSVLFWDLLSVLRIFVSLPSSWGLPFFPSFFLFFCFGAVSVSLLCTPRKTLIL